MFPHHLDMVVVDVLAILWALAQSCGATIYEHYGDVPQVSFDFVVVGSASAILMLSIIVLTSAFRRTGWERHGEQAFRRSINNSFAPRGGWIVRGYYLDMKVIL